ncbi:signal recognition particle protein Srp19 [Methanonatronarchaeum sp. AMET-Sl]|uniref:signal recognition particle protein Srp19 n=1 Tax=Methanonatronarchaeum sp. AMET-Sl TaxID=3037654 RepID=UPI00244DD4BF|nr:signal recognition particle protein Srp19 [Methanonatronarchaeum sp. AMET-Sl]WGI16798.1 signal recognition particle protein Srp19 [Methanonatronarchaeum sp. AMET-Sl]
MVGNDKDRMVLWPSNIDVDKSRGSGRIIAREDAVSNPKLSRMEKAASELDLDPVVEEDKAYPGFWWESEGRLVVDKVKGKTEVAREIAGKMR